MKLSTHVQYFAHTAFLRSAAVTFNDINKISAMLINNIDNTCINFNNDNNIVVILIIFTVLLNE